MFNEFNINKKDKELKYSTAGPHRDDLKIEIDGKDSRKFASQGQQRSAALSLKLAEIEFVERWSSRRQRKR